LADFFAVLFRDITALLYIIIAI